MSDDESSPDESRPDDARPDDARTAKVRRSRVRRPRTAAAPPADPAAWRSLGIIAAIAAVLVLIGLLAPVPEGADGAAGAVEPVESSTVVCPEPGSFDGSRTTSAITVVPDLEGQDRAGEAVVAFLEGGESDGEGQVVTEGQPATDVPVEGDLAAPGDAAQVVEEESRLPALEVRTLGGLAPGLVAAQITQDSFNEGRGLASQACLGPDTTWWFVGGGSTAGRESQLVLVNPEDSPADLEVAISGPDGPVSTPRLRGIVVEPRSRVVVRLSREAPRLPAAAWRVTVRQGRVMAALSDKETEGFVPRGADWIPASADPATRVLVPGVIGGEGGRQLLIHTPGDLSATVRVRLITEGGSFVPVALPAVEVPGGAVVAVDLDAALRGDDATVDLQSDVPIVAGVRQRHPAVDAAAGSLEETSFTAGARLIDGMAAVTGLPAERSTGVTVWMTAPDAITTIERAPMGEEMGAASQTAEPMADMTSAPADDSGASSAPAATASSGDDSGTGPVLVTLRILAVSPEGDLLTDLPDITAEVPSGRLVAVDVPRPEGAAWYSIVATVSGGEVVMAHRALRRNKDGSLITGYPWRPLRTTVVVPRAVPAPGLVLPGL